jgi:hypothetical protein
VDVEVYFHTFLSSTLDGCEWSRFTLQALYPLGKIPRYPWNRKLETLQKRRISMPCQEFTIIPLLYSP